MKFQIEQLTLPGVLKITFDSFSDLRGDIFTLFNGDLSKKLESLGYGNFVHDKIVINKKNVLRGIHFDSKTVKLVTCLRGHITQYVVCVDKLSKQFGSYEKIEMQALNCLVLLPSGYGNAFVSRKHSSIYFYKLSYTNNYIDAEDQQTIKWNDPRFDIDWGGQDFIMSNRDK